MSSIFLMSHDLSEPIRTGSEKAQKLRDAPAKEAPHFVGVWTLKTEKTIMKNPPKFEIFVK